MEIALSPQTIFLVIVVGVVLLLGGMGAGLAFVASQLDKANKAKSAPPQEPAADTRTSSRVYGTAVLTFLITLTTLVILTGLLFGPQLSEYGLLALVAILLVSVVAAAIAMMISRLDSRDPEAESEKAERGHGKPYFAVFVILAVLTAIEVAVSFMPVFRAPILAALATAKIVLVAMFYMHLRSDSRVFSLTILVPIPFVILIMAALLLAY